MLKMVHFILCVFNHRKLKWGKVAMECMKDRGPHVHSVGIAQSN